MLPIDDSISVLTITSGFVRILPAHEGPAYVAVLSSIRSICCVGVSTLALFVGEQPYFAVPAKSFDYDPRSSVLIVADDATISIWRAGRVAETASGSTGVDMPNKLAAIPKDERLTSWRIAGVRKDEVLLAGLAALGDRMTLLLVDIERSKVEKEVAFSIGEALSVRGARLKFVSQIGSEPQVYVQGVADEDEYEQWLLALRDPWKIVDSEELLAGARVFDLPDVMLLYTRGSEFVAIDAENKFIYGTLEGNSTAIKFEIEELSIGSWMPVIGDNAVYVLAEDALLIYEKERGVLRRATFNGYGTLMPTVLPDGTVVAGVYVRREIRGGDVRVVI